MHCGLIIVSVLVWRHIPPTGRLAPVWCVRYDRRPLHVVRTTGGRYMLYVRGATRFARGDIIASRRVATARVAERGATSRTTVQSVPTATQQIALCCDTVPLQRVAT